MTDSDTKGKKMRGITIDISNKNIPQLTLVGRTRCVVLYTNLLLADDRQRSSFSCAAWFLEIISY